MPTLILALRLSISAILGILAVYLFRLIPCKWLCDYGEKPSEKHMKANRRLGVGYYAVCAVICTVFTYFAQQSLTGLRLYISPLIVALLLLLALCDIKYTIVPNELCIIIAVLSLPVATQNGMWRPFVGAGIVAAVLLAAGFVMSKIFKKDAFGMGDVVLGALAGWICGYGYLMQMAVVTLISAAISFAVQMLFKKITIKSTAPFAPYFVCGILSVMCFSGEWQNIIKWYFSLFKL